MTTRNRLLHNFLYAERVSGITLGVLIVIGILVLRLSTVLPFSPHWRIFAFLYALLLFSIWGTVFIGLDALGRPIIKAEPFVSDTDKVAGWLAYLDARDTATVSSQGEEP